MELLPLFVHSGSAGKLHGDVSVINFYIRLLWFGI